MQLGTALTQQACPGCKSQLSVPAVLRDGEWWHRKCYDEDVRLFTNTTRLSNALPGIYLRIPESQEVL